MTSIMNTAKEKTEGAGYPAFLGVDLGGTNIRTGKTRQGENGLLKYYKQAISSRAPEAQVLEEIFHAINQVMDYEISAIGIGVPSLVDVKTGVVYSVENIPSWKEVHLKEILEKRYRLPVHINNDANCFALGEAWFGKGRKFSNIVGLIVGTGLGAGIIIQRRLYNGSNCGAGEIGMIAYKDKNIEHYSCGQYFIREYGVSGGELYERALRGDNNALEIFQRFGHHLANAIQTVMYSYDPEIIIMGGSVSKAFTFYKKTMWETLNNFAYPHALKRLALECSDSEHIPLLGAAALCFESSCNL